MSDQSVFEKRYVDPSKQSNIEGLLEHFNLPPKVISFLRRYKRQVQIGLGLLLAVVVAYSLYDNYQESRIENSASALAKAQELAGQDQVEALEKVVADYDGTDAATWAMAELGHQALKSERYSDAVSHYRSVLQDVEADNPLRPLALLGEAQALEIQGETKAAYGVYEQLTTLTGYQFLGYTSMARIHESEGEIEQALGIFGQYKTLLTTEGEADGAVMAFIDDSITRLQALQ